MNLHEISAQLANCKWFLKKILWDNFTLQNFRIEYILRERLYSFNLTLCLEFERPKSSFEIIPFFLDFGWHPFFEYRQVFKSTEQFFLNRLSPDWNRITKSPFTLLSHLHDRVQRLELFAEYKLAHKSIRSSSSNSNDTKFNLPEMINRLSHTTYCAVHYTATCMWIFPLKSIVSSTFSFILKQLKYEIAEEESLLKYCQQFVWTFFLFSSGGNVCAGSRKKFEWNLMTVYWSFQ